MMMNATIGRKRARAKGACRSDLVIREGNKEGSS
jgi:hypothetical protein